MRGQVRRHAPVADRPPDGRVQGRMRLLAVGVGRIGTAPAAACSSLEQRGQWWAGGVRPAQIIHERGHPLRLDQRRDGRGVGNAGAQQGKEHRPELGASAGQDGDPPVFVGPSAGVRLPAGSRSPVLAAARPVSRPADRRPARPPGAPSARARGCVRSADRPQPPPPAGIGSWSRERSGWRPDSGSGTRECGGRRARRQA